VNNISKNSGSESEPTERLAIGDVAARTGLSTATLRAWESRHGFPLPDRRDSGHRRYDERTVDAVRSVVRRRDDGVRLDAAIAAALADLERIETPAPRSIFAELRRRHPQLPVQRMSKRTLLALSWAIEDEFCARADRPRIMGAFESERYWTAAAARWTELARVATSALVFADFPDLATADAVEPGRPVRVPLSADSPMRREWAVICESRDLPVALTAWEVPGQQGRPDPEREFDAIWTVDPSGVRAAARAAARVAAESTPAGQEMLYALADEPEPAVADLVSVSQLFTRLLAYVDRFAVR